jgi:hypothetical protein
MQTCKAAPEATFQFFYSSKETCLPHPNVPTRDVTNSHGQDNKREPNLERMMENWCSCRSSIITAAAKRALELAEEGRQHYLVLTTRDPRNRNPQKDSALAVGLLPFSCARFKAALRRDKGRWTRRLPYVSDQTLTICSFDDGFRLEMKTSKDRSTHVPGSRYTSPKVPPELLKCLIAHFALKPNRLQEFLANVRALENRLKNTEPKAYKHYRADNPLVRCGS